MNSILGASLIENAGCIRNIPVGIIGTSWQPDYEIESLHEIRDIL